MSPPLYDNAWSDVLALMVASERYVAQLRARLHLSGNEMHALLALHTDGPSTISELSSKVQLSRPTMTSMVDRLHLLGWLERSAHATDRRKVIVTASPEFTRALLEHSTPWRHRLRNVASSRDDWPAALDLMAEVRKVALRSAWQLSNGDGVIR